MKKGAFIAVIILTFLAAAGALYQASQSLDRYIPWNFLVSEWTRAAFTILFGIALIIHFIRNMPRFIMLLSGAAVFSFINEFVIGHMYALFLITAGVVTAVSELKRHGKMEKAAVNPAKSGILTATGVLAGVFAVYYTIFNAVTIDMTRFFGSADLLTAVTTAVSLAGIAVFCFLKSKRNSVYYRLFFAGQLLLNVLLGPTRLLLNIELDTMVWEYSLYVLGCTALLALVLVDAVRNSLGERNTSEPQTDTVIS